MAWTDLFKSKSPKLRPDGTLRWFGKLPTYRDYYRSPLDDAWALEFNDWISKGYEMYHSRVASPSFMASLTAGEQHDARVQPVRRLPLSGCILRLPRSGMTVLASIQDYGGDAAGRPFPISFYVAVPTADWPGPASDGLVGAIRVLRELMGLRQAVVRLCNTPGRFESVFGSRELNLDGIDGSAHDDRWLQQAADIPMTDWLEGALNGLAAPELAAWPRLAARWGENISRLDSESFNPTFALPMASGIGWEVQMAGWIRWLETRMDLTRRNLSLIVTDEPGQTDGRLVVIAREPVVDDFLLLTGLWSTLPYLDDLSAIRDETPEGDGEAVGSTGPTCQSWKDFAALPRIGAEA